MTLQSKPTVLILINHYLPGEKVGGPVRTTSNMVSWLGDDFDFRILTSDRDIGDTEAYKDIEYGVWHQVGKAQVRYLSPHEQSLNLLRKLFNSITYNLVYIDGVFATFTVKALSLNRLGLLPSVPIIIVPRGHWRPEALRIKPFKKRIFMVFAHSVGLYRNLSWHVSSSEEYTDIQRLVTRRIQSARVIPNLPLPPTMEDDRQRLFKRPSYGRLVFLSRIVRNKGLRFLLERLNSIKGDIEFHIYGSKEDKIYWQECETYISTLPDNVTVEYRGVVKFDEVISTLSQYHLFVLPTISENFGHVILEALAAGCPILISDRTPWQNLLGAGWVLGLDDMKGWENALQQLINMNQMEFDQMAKVASCYGEKYRNNQQMADDLRDFFMELIR